ncbi:hypothetical protein BE20_06325 [Sorangium cellulosum]|uniref:Uncharacterized protein n=1 Tax=Sorangium cellulosum TaxID=56 RepID=A0A150R9C3_SORCE|nr:hypothetical protein BE18_39455 [Sorangium cellulosum]KYF94544.1 hypothetical protein BE20_06325 [Sorangium cellulosum]
MLPQIESKLIGGYRPFIRLFEALLGITMQLDPLAQTLDPCIELPKLLPAGVTPSIRNGMALSPHGHEEWR